MKILRRKIQPSVFMYLFMYQFYSSRPRSVTFEIIRTRIYNRVSRVQFLNNNNRMALQGQRFDRSFPSSLLLDFAEVDFRGDRN